MFGVSNVFIKVINSCFFSVVSCFFALCDLCRSLCVGGSSVGGEGVILVSSQVFPTTAKAGFTEYVPDPNLSLIILIGRWWIRIVLA